MDIVGALVGVDRLEIHTVPDHVVFVGDAVAAVHVASDARDVERLAAVVALQQEMFSGASGPASISARAQTALQTEADLGLHVGEFHLDQLVGGQRPSELLSVERVRRAACQQNSAAPSRAPGDAVARVVEAAERAA